MLSRRRWGCSRTSVNAFSETASQLAELAVVIARRVIAREMSLDPSLVRAWCAKVWTRSAARPRVVRLGRGFGALEQRLSRPSRQRRAEVRVEPAPEHACLVETELGQVDESVETRLGTLLHARNPERPDMLDRLIERCRTAAVHKPEGVVSDVVGLIVEVGGLNAAVGDTLALHDASGTTLEVEVVGFRGGRLLTTPLGPLSGIRPGARVVLTPRRRGAGFVRPARSRGRLVRPPARRRARVDARARDAGECAAAARVCARPIDQPFRTGVRVIDAMLPLGVGQRMGIFAGAGVGKSTLLGMICRTVAGRRERRRPDRRARSRAERLHPQLARPGGSGQAVVVAATSDQPPLVRARGAESATAIAEYFRDQGKSVLL